ncbi:hypothetical protein CR513_13756, partial [Mucuna pruriens]
MDRNMINVASGGALMDKTPTTARHLISNIASNTQQFGIRERVGTSKVVSEVSTFDSQRLENQLTELTSLVRQLVVGQHQQAMQRESKMESTECIGALGGRHQYGRQSYPNRQFDNQQFRRQPYRPNPNQVQHTTPRFGPTETMPGSCQANYQQ